MTKSYKSQKNSPQKNKRTFAINLIKNKIRKMRLELERSANEHIIDICA